MYNIKKRDLADLAPYLGVLCSRQCGSEIRQWSKQYADVLRDLSDVLSPGTDGHGCHVSVYTPKLKRL